MSEASLKPRRERHCGAHCPDDICRGTQTCMVDGQPIGEECPICHEEVIAEYGEECSCERQEYDDEFWDSFYGD